MNNERAFQQMVQLLADLDIQTWVGVFEDNVLLGLEEGFGVEFLAGTCFGDGVDVGPF